MLSLMGMYWGTKPDGNRGDTAQLPRLVSDFFYPNMGGVESHLFHLGQQLIQRGHKVVVVTHAYGQRTGIRYVTNGLKVYYLPAWVGYQQATPPTFFAFFPILRCIFVREQIQVVHGHQALSPLCHEAIFHARTMGLRTCFTDHSLFGFNDLGNVVGNKVLKFTLSDVDHVICVSHTSKENTVLRAALDPQDVSVIPNAIAVSQFVPDPSAPDPNWITIVVISRLAYRKGIDLLVAVIPRVCAIFPKVRFLIDGAKRIDLEQMRENCLLHDRVRFIGSVKHHEVRNVLVQGNIFLNTSLTEAFCIAVVEAASCGLTVVSTHVGGIPEVLPPHMICFAQPEENDLVRAVMQAVKSVQMKEVMPMRQHAEVKEMYSWANVAARTEVVYKQVMRINTPPFIERLRRYYGCGLWAGKLFCIMAAIDLLFLVLLEWWLPREAIEIAPSFPTKKYKRIRQMTSDKSGGS
ncbi:hypothetical protein SYNPS1DRAFT_21239 [Syncephalis pseudoplumigaleata]|uniref:Phosphatidylinositol N-acetylglucosaminyltransferase GPI3 subunit n=1 Tax=Syncephalis pseudoplumigaleata TaxID=1712513 RepID=A0A4P9Z3P5_9FUNG|nr:hypothetical protein SYNPS1DRAFT_21239 [Syncephalis pseudoplumigaleata]|eukprot:RKP27164.1 hypothetical protein SYNPS1DRAFT_21239 [Syncephalis pseudoplumigaleata]